MRSGQREHPGSGPWPGQARCRDAAVLVLVSWSPVEGSWGGHGSASRLGASDQRQLATRQGCRWRSDVAAVVSCSRVHGVEGSGLRAEGPGECKGSPVSPQVYVHLVSLAFWAGGVWAGGVQEVPMHLGVKRQVVYPSKPGFDVGKA